MQHVRRLVVIGTETHYGRQILKGVHDYCRLHGSWEYQLVGHSTPEALLDAREIIRHWKPDGIIVPIGNDRVARMMRSLSVPIVNVDTNRAPELPTVIPDDRTIRTNGSPSYLLWTTVSGNSASVSPRAGRSIHLQVRRFCRRC